jgi:putative phage-type endonuclease
MDRLVWLRERQKGVGSSDAPNLVGVGFGDAASVYRSKVEPPDDREPRAGVLARGIALEETVARLYAETMGVVVGHPAPIVFHPDRPWQFASLDRVRDDGRPVELKTTAGFGEAWGAAGTDQIPDGYRVQAQHQMGVIGADSIDLAALDVIAWELRVYRVPFDPDLFAWLTAVEETFWRGHVLPRVPPGPEWDEQLRADALALVEKGKRVELGAGAVELIERRKELAAIRDEADAECKRLGRLLEAQMGDAEIATAGGWIVPGGEVSYTRDPYTRLDVRAGKPLREKA